MLVEIINNGGFNVSNTDLSELFSAANNAAIAATRPFDLPNGNKAVLIPNTYNIRECAPALPDHVKQRVAFESGDSFIAYVNAFKNKDGATLLLATARDFNEMGIVAVLNYHNPNEASIVVSHADHQARFIPQFSEQYARWRKIDEVPQTQNAFAEFVEEFCRDIVEPPSAMMMTIAADLEMSSALDYKSKVNTQNGMVQLKFIESGSARTTDGVEVPKTFMLRVPIFFGEEPVNVPVFLRFRAGKQLTFSIKIQDRETMEKQAFLGAVARIGEKTDMVPLLGRI
jgi:uncharacterized protein YfdQ (DUF2303 family)